MIMSGWRALSSAFGKQVEIEEQRAQAAQEEKITAEWIKQEKKIDFLHSFL